MAAAAVVLPEPAAPLEQADIFQLLQEHRRAPLSIVRADGYPYALGGDSAALVTALLRLAQETLLLHALATADPDRPVAGALSQAVKQLEWS